MDMVIKEIKDEAIAGNIPIVLDDTIDFIRKFIEEQEIKNILEIGTAVGYSAIMMASLNDDIRVITIERDEERYFKALENIKKVGLEDRITLIYKDALDVSLEGPFDMIFLDAAKSQNIKFFNKFGLALKPHGFIITDNLNFHGYVDKDPEEIESKNIRGIVKKTQEFKQFLIENERYETMFYDIGDGISISEKVV